MTQVIQQVAKPAINNYLCNKYNLSSDEILTRLSNHFYKISKSNAAASQYYYDNKDNPDYQAKLKNSRQDYYNSNKVKIRALARAKYDNDPIYRSEYQRYQALYSQKKRNVDSEQKRGRPRKYLELESS